MSPAFDGARPGPRGTTERRARAASGLSREAETLICNRELASKGLQHREKQHSGLANDVWGALHRDRHAPRLII
jgi:hypothetical protein